MANENPEESENLESELLGEGSVEPLQLGGSAEVIEISDVAANRIIDGLLKEELRNQPDAKDLLGALSSELKSPDDSNDGRIDVKAMLPDSGINIAGTARVEIRGTERGHMQDSGLSLENDSTITISPEDEQN